MGRVGATVGLCGKSLALMHHCELGYAVAFFCVPDIAELLLSYYIFNNAARGQQGGQE